MPTCRRDLLPIGTLLLLGSLAFVDLMALPAFEDEGSQLRLLWRAVAAGEWLQPLGEGKPLEAWLMVPAVHFSPPLAAIRALHVVAGMVGPVLLYCLARRLADRWTAWASGVVFAVCPFLVYLERLALSDVFLCTAGIWVLLNVIRLVEATTWPRAVALGLSLVLAAFCKLPVGFIFLITMPIALLTMPQPERTRLLHRPFAGRLLAAHVPAILLAVVIAVVAVVRWRRGHVPGFGLQDLLGIGVGEYRSLAAGGLGPRPSLINELTTQLSVPVAVLGLIGLAAATLRGDWRLRWLMLVGAVPMLVIGFFVSFWFPRYLLFTLPPLIIAATCGWRSMAERAGRYRRGVAAVALAVCVGFMSRQSALIILDPPAANWSRVDRTQYFEGSGSGYGYPEAARFVLAAPDVPPLIYALDGHSAQQLLTYLSPAWNTRVTPIYYAPDGKELRSEADRFANLATHTPAWLIIPQPLLSRYLIATFGASNADRIGLRQLALFDKPGGLTQLAVYEITPLQPPT